MSTQSDKNKNIIIAMFELLQRKRIATIMRDCHFPQIRIYSVLAKAALITPETKHTPVRKTRRTCCHWVQRKSRTGTVLESTLSFSLDTVGCLLAHHSPVKQN